MNSNQQINLFAHEPANVAWVFNGNLERVVCKLVEGLKYVSRLIVRGNPFLPIPFFEILISVGV